MAGYKITMLRVLLIASSILAIVFAITTVMRMRLPYDESGVYFDEEKAVTYDTDGLLVYGVLAGLFSFLSGILYYFVKRKK
jgi:hypothetical protein